jgi:hypothetical protein
MCQRSAVKLSRIARAYFVLQLFKQPRDVFFEDPLPGRPQETVAVFGAKIGVTPQGSRWSQTALFAIENGQPREIDGLTILSRGGPGTAA